MTACCAVLMNEFCSSEMLNICGSICEWVSEWVILHALKDIYAINIPNLLQSLIALCSADRYVLLGISHGSLSGNDNLGAVASMMELARVFRVLSRDRGNWIYLYWYIRLNHDKLEGIACPEYISFLSDSCRLVFGCHECQICLQLQPRCSIVSIYMNLHIKFWSNKIIFMLWLTFCINIPFFSF